MDFTQKALQRPFKPLASLVPRRIAFSLVNGCQWVIFECALKSSLIQTSFLIPITFQVCIGITEVDGSELLLGGLSAKSGSSDSIHRDSPSESLFRE